METPKQVAEHMLNAAAQCNPAISFDKKIQKENDKAFAIHGRSWAKQRVIRRQKEFIERLEEQFTISYLWNPAIDFEKQVLTELINMQ